MSCPPFPCKSHRHHRLGFRGGVFCPKWRGREDERCQNPAAASPELGEHLPVGLKICGKQRARLSALVNSLEAASACFRLDRLISAPLGACVLVCVCAGGGLHCHWLSFRCPPTYLPHHLGVSLNKTSPPYRAEEIKSKSLNGFYINIYPDEATAELVG